MPETRWWESFYSGLWLDLQRQSKTEGQTRAEADFIENRLQLTPGARVLDVPCGTGRLSLELAARGYHMTGVDITQPFLDDARCKAAERRLEIAWELRDMRDLPWQAEFDAAFCFWGSFGHLDEDGNVAFLKAVSRTLKAGARFLLDAIVVETFLPRFQERGWAQIGDILLLQELRHDHVHSRANFEYTLIREGKVEKKSTSIRLYTYHELCQLLGAVGFADCEGYGSLSREPFKLGSRWLYLVATKKR